jgi:sorbitol/mannitol transport system permease protein
VSAAVVIPGSRRVAPRLLLAPSVAMLLLWMIVPLAMTLWFSVEHYNLLAPGNHAFAGVSNYVELLTHRAVWIAMGNTLLMLGLILGVTITFGTAFIRSVACWL